MHIYLQSFISFFYGISISDNRDVRDKRADEISNEQFRCACRFMRLSSSSPINTEINQGVVIDVAASRVAALLIPTLRD